MRATVLIFFAAVAHAAPAEHRWDGPRVSIVVPAGATVTEVSDIAADYALEIVPPSGPHLALLVGNAKVADAELQSQGVAWRDKRLRNRASWGVPSSGGRRVEETRIGSQRVVRYVDDLQSQMGARQIMLCAVLQTHLTCAVASGDPDQSTALEASLTRLLAGARPSR